ncbi:uncharacterized protein LOC119453496 isoform X3 [Dermacentor silvarum]|uniref:uncharacterized protein LOC119453496 isoform X3 n=1 Tax=Dermacentor silvarum TaxID=543639 RepID=UPI002100C71B|nr:uncharacterized protein LOC119453496 isoform X3 [Dermacentor silvarum]
MDEASTSSSPSIGARGFGRPRKYANEAEARDARNAARRARRRKAAAALLKAPLSPNSRRAQRSAAMKEKRQNNPDLRRREADLKKQKRSSDPELRRREAELRKRKRKEEASAKRERRRLKLTGANNRLKKAFMDKLFGSVCSVCDRLCFANDLSAAKESACALLGQHFLDRDVTAVQCCSGMGCTPAVSMGHCGVEMVSKATTTAKLKVDATTQCAVLRIPKSTMASRVKLTSTTGMQTERITEEVGRPSKLWEETNPDWAPSLLLGYSSRHADPARYDRAKKRRLQKDEADAASAAVSAAIAESIGTDTGDAVEGQPPPGDEDESGTEMRLVCNFLQIS